MYQIEVNFWEIDYQNIVSNDILMDQPTALKKKNIYIYI